jgi:hypothetical protein
MLEPEMNKKEIYKFAHLYNEAKANVMKRTNGSSLAPLALRMDEEELVEIMEEFVILLDKNGYRIKEKPEMLTGELGCDPFPPGKLLE